MLITVFSPFLPYVFELHLAIVINEPNIRKIKTGHICPKYFFQHQLLSIFNWIFAMQSNEFLVLLGQRIVKLRNEKQIKQFDLAIACNMDDSSLRKIEKGKINITINTLLKISNALEIDVKTLIDF